MSEVKVIKCPNCGANTTNPRNCEYCGSLLVRFVDQDIDLANTSYLDDTQTLPGLENAMKMNLMMQKSNPDQCVVTDIYKKDLTCVACVLRTGYAAFKDRTPIPSQSEEGLCVIFGFERYDDEDYNVDIKKYNREQEKLHQKFRALDIFPLFSERVCRSEDEDWGMYKIYEYYIDFGQDAVGASRLISKVLLDVEGLSPDEQLECYTNAGDNIGKSREEIDRIPNKENEKNGKRQYAVLILVGVVAFCICYCLGAGFWKSIAMSCIICSMVYKYYT